MAEPYPPSAGNEGNDRAAVPKVLYIGGTGRTGSTLLTRLLGQVPGWFAAGELAFLWRFGLAAGGRCSCGAPIRDCPVWGATLEGVEAAGHHIDPDRMVALRKRCWSIHLPLLAHPRLAERSLDRLDDYPAIVEATYRALAATTGDRIIVDSSKEPHYSAILHRRTSLDVRFLHLVRDPRAVGRSWRRHRRETGLDKVAHMETRGAAKVALYYDVSNIAAESIWRDDPSYRFMRYEDFVADPNAALGAIAALMDEPPPDPMLVTDRRFHAESGHMAWGNPNRFDGGTIEIRPDDGWRRDLPAHARLAVSAGTGGLARRYGYRLARTDAPPAPPVPPLARVMIPEPAEDTR